MHGVGAWRGGVQWKLFPAACVSVLFMAHIYPQSRKVHEIDPIFYVFICKQILVKLIGVNKGRRVTLKLETSRMFTRTYKT